jgi:tetratricopeptide (TPR) repeat protein
MIQLLPYLHRHACWVVVLAANVGGVARGFDPPDAAHASLQSIAGIPLDHAPNTPMSEDQRKRLEIAQSLFDKGDWVDSIQSLETLRDEPGGDSCDVNMLLALACLRMKFDGEALEAAVRASRLPGRGADANVLAGSLLVKQGKPVEAIPHFRAATLAADLEVNNPNVTWAWLQLGRVLQEQGYLTAAGEAFRRFDSAIWVTHTEHQDASEISDWLASNPRGAFDVRIAICRQLADVPARLALATGAAERWPDDSVAGRAQIEALMDAGRANEAFDRMLPRLTDAAERSAYLHLAVAAALEADRLAGWLGDLEPADAGSGAMPLAVAVAGALSKQGRLPEAVRLADAILKVAPDKTDIVLLAAEARAALGDGAAALDLLATAVRAHGDGEAWSGRQIDRAVAMAASIPDLSNLVKQIESAGEPDFASRFILGIAAQAAGDRAAAATHYSAVIAAQPACAVAQMARAELMLSRYAWADAKAYATALIAEYPKLAAAQYVLGRALEGLDESEAAEAAYRQAVRLDEREPAYAVTLGKYYQRTAESVGDGRISSAQRFFSIAISVDPTNDEAFERLIESYLVGRKAELAVSEFNRLKDGGVSDDAIRRVATTLRFVNEFYSQAHISALAEQIESHPEDVETRKKYAEGLFQTRQYEQATEQTHLAMSLAPDDEELAFYAAEMLRRRAMFSESAEILQRLSDRYPNRVELQSRLADVLIADFQLAEGRALLRRLMQNDATDTYRMQLFDSYRDFLEIDEGLALVDEWLKDDPKDLGNRRLKVGLLILGDRNDEACELVETWLTAAPDDPQWMRLRIDVLQDADRAKEAFALASQWLADQPDDLDRRTAAYASGHAAKAFAELETMIRSWMNAGDVLGNPAGLAKILIDVLIEDDRPDDAMQVAREFEGAYSDQVVRRMWMGRCHAAAGNLDLAKSEFEALLAERTLPREGKPAVRREYIAALADLKAFAEAVKLCDEWIAESESTKLDYLDLKLRLLQTAQADDQAVAAVWEQILAYRRDDVGGNNDLGYTWAELGVRLAEAESMIRLAIGQDPRNASFIDSLGWVLYKRGDFAGACRQLSRAARLRNGRDGVIFDHLGDAQYRLDEHDAALESWKRAIEILEGQKTPLLRREEALLAQLQLKIEAMADGRAPAGAEVPGVVVD